MNNIANLQSLLETTSPVERTLCIHSSLYTFKSVCIQVCIHSSMYTFKSAFTAALTALVYSEEDGKVRRYLFSITNVAFIITLLTIEQSRLPLTSSIQCKQATTTIAKLQQEKADPKVWNAFFDSVVEVAERFEIEARRAMLVDRCTVCENVPADITDTPSQYWMRAMHLPFLDHLLQEMDTRLLVAQNHYVNQYPTPRQQTHLTPEKIVQLYDVFEDDMSGDLRQLQHLRQSRRWWVSLRHPTLSMT